MRLFRHFNDGLLRAQVNPELDADARAERLRRRQRNMRRAAPWLLWLVLVLFGSLLIPDSAGLDWRRVLVGVALVPPVSAIGWIRMRALREADELERRMELMAMSSAFIMAICLFLLLTLLQMIDLPITLLPLAALWLLLGTYLVVQGVLQRRDQ
ncbi:MAG: hypothetical protein WCD66_03490 [Rhodanobacteraceae bacterium]